MEDPTGTTRARTTGVTFIRMCRRNTVNYVDREEGGCVAVFPPDLTYRYRRGEPTTKSRVSRRWRNCRFIPRASLAVASNARQIVSRFREIACTGTNFVPVDCSFYSKDLGFWSVQKYVSRASLSRKYRVAICTSNLIFLKLRRLIMQKTKKKYII